MLSEKPFFDRLEARQLLSTVDLSPFHQVGPNGSLVYASEIDESLDSVGEIDSFSAVLEIGQTISISIQPQVAVAPQVNLRDPSGIIIASVRSQEAGEASLIQNIPVAAAGEYTIEILDPDGGTGPYSGKVILNAAIESEAFATGNSSIVNAMSLDGSFLVFDTVERAAIYATRDSVEWFEHILTQTGPIVFPNTYSFSFNNIPTLVDFGRLKTSSSGEFEFPENDLHMDIEGVVQDVVFDGQPNGDFAAVEQLRISKDDLLQIVDDGSLIVDYTPSEFVDDGSLSDFISSQLVAPVQADYYSFTLEPGEVASIALRHDGALGDIAKLELVDASNQVLASGVAGSLPGDQSIRGIRSTMGGSYYVRVINENDYSLVVTRDADIEQERNDTFELAESHSDVLIGSVGDSFSQRLFIAGTRGISEFDPITGSEFRNFPIPQSGNPRDLVADLAHTGNSLVFSGIGRNGFDAEIYELDLVSGEVVSTMIIPDFPVVVTTFSQGQLVLGGSGTIVFVDWETGVETRRIVPATSIQTLAADGDRLLGTSSWHVFEIDPMTGETTLLGDLENEVRPYSITIAGDELIATWGNTFYRYDRTTFELIDSFTDPLSTKLFAVGGFEGTTAEDFHSIHARVGDTLGIETATPLDGQGNPFNILDPAIDLFDPTGTQVESDENGADDGRNASISYTALMDGEYHIRVRSENEMGAYTLNIDGATGSSDQFQVVKSIPIDGVRTSDPPNELILSFSHVVDLTTLEPSDVTINGQSLSQMRIVDGDTVAFTLLDNSDDDYQVTISPSAFQSIGGEGLQAFTQQFTIDTTAPRVIATSIEHGGVYTGRDFVMTIQFDEELNESVVEQFSTISFEEGLALSLDYDPASSTLTLTRSNMEEGAYTLRLNSDRFVDLIGHELDGELVNSPLPPNVSGDGLEGGDFVINVNVDFDDHVYVLDSRLTPIGTLVHQGSLTFGRLHDLADTDSYLIDLQAGQTLSVELINLSSPHVQLFDPDGILIDETSIVTAVTQRPAVIQNAPITKDGVYTIVVGGEFFNVGDYKLRATANAALGDIDFPGYDNESRASSFSLDDGFISLPFGGSRAVILDANDDPLVVLEHTEVVDLVHPNVIEYSYQTIDPPTGDGLLVIEAKGDFSHSSKFLTLDIEGLLTQDLPYSRNHSRETIEIPIPLGILQAVSADNLIEIELIPSIDVQEGQNSDYIRTYIQYPIAESRDHFAFTLEAGQTVSIEGFHRELIDLELELLDSNGELLTTGLVTEVPFAENTSSSIHHFVAPETGVYFARVSGTLPEVGSTHPSYTLVATIGTMFAIEMPGPLDTTVSDITRQPNVLGGIDGVGDIDTFSFEAVAGDALDIETATPLDGARSIENLLNPTLELVDPSGAVVVIDDDGASDGRNARIIHSATETGTYQIRVASSDDSVGEYQLRLGGLTGESPTHVIATDPSAGALLIAAPNTMSIQFSRAVLTSSLDESDFLVNGSSVLGFILDSEDKVVLTLPPLAEGIHTIMIHEDAIFDLAGESVAAFTTAFEVDETPPQIETISVQQNDVLPVGATEIVVGFSESLSVAGIDSADIQLMGARVGIVAPEIVSFSGDGTTLTVNYADLSDDRYTLRLFSGDGQFEDLAGNDLDGEPVQFPLPPNTSGDGTAGGDFVVEFEVDITSISLNDSFEALLPLGTLAHQASEEAAVFDSSDVDEFQFSIDAGQVIHVRVAPDESLQASVTLLGPNDQQLSSGTSISGGANVVLSSPMIDTAGIYKIQVESTGGTVGSFQVDVYLNAELESESSLGIPNDDLPTAQVVNPIVLSNEVLSAVILGQADGGGHFQSSFVENDTLFSPNVISHTFSLLPPAVGSGFLRISAVSDLDGSNEFLTVDIDGLITTDVFVFGGLSGDLVTNDVTLSENDLQLLLSDGEVTVTVTPSSAVGSFEDESLTATLSYEAFEPTGDTYAIQAEAGDVLNLAVKATETGQISVKLLDPAGNLIAIGANQPRSVDQIIDGYVVPTTDTYYAIVEGFENADYTLVVTNNAAFESEPSDLTSNPPRNITINGAALGQLTALVPADKYSVHVNAGDDLVIETATPFDGSALPLNELDPLVELYDPLGALVAMDDNSAADGRNARINHQALTTGKYVVVVKHNVISPMAGLNAEYFLLGDEPVTDFPEFDSLTPDVTQIDEQVAIASTPDAFNGLDGFIDHFAVQWTGAVYIEKPGDVTFFISSDDGSRLFVDGNVLIDHGGMHGMTERASTIRLSEGFHDIRFEMFENEGNAGAQLRYRPIDSVKHLIPPQVLFQSAGPVTRGGSYLLNITGSTHAMPALVESTEPGDQSVLALPPNQLIVHFNQNVLVSTIDSGDLRLNGVDSIGFSIIDGNSVVFDLAIPPTEGTHVVSIGAGDILSLNGDPIAALDHSFVVDLTDPVVFGMAVNDGDPQRSVLTDIRLQFNEPVVIALGALRLTNTSNGQEIDGIDNDVEFDPTTNTFVWDLSNLSDGIPDGNYVGTLVASGVTDLSGRMVDGDGDGQVGGDFIFPLYVLFGDSDGDREVGVSDLFGFRNTYLLDQSDASFNKNFDGNFDGVVGIFDLFRFRSNYLTTIPELQMLVQQPVMQGSLLALLANPDPKLIESEDEIAKPWQDGSNLDELWESDYTTQNSSIRSNGDT